jgi:hypothetical protein
MNVNKLMLATLLACAFAPALAEDMGDAGQAPVERHIVTRNGADIKVQVGQLDELRALDGMSFPLARVHGKPVRNAPYSAEMVQERQQNLADGNEILTRNSTMSYRDREGRTRHEVRDNKGEVRTVTINDPVANVTYVLHPQGKTATKVSTDFRALGEAARAAGEAARAAAAAARAAGTAGREVIVKRVERADGDSARKVQEDVRIRVENDLGDGKGKTTREMVLQIGPLVGSAFGDAKWASKATSKDLGSREMDGVKAEGKLRSYDIPAGEVGNRNPIVISDEFWYSPELQVTLYTRHSDPRYGDTIFRLQGLKREEPAAALFTVPADYTVRDVMANVARKLEQKKP